MMTRVSWVRRWIAIALVVAITGCSSPVPRPDENTLRSQLAILVNRASNGDQESWNNALVEKQISASLPKGSATPLGWMLEWKPADGALAYAIIPWSMLGVADPQLKAKTVYGGGPAASAQQAREITSVVIEGLDSTLTNVVAVHSIRIIGNYAAFSVTPLLPVADDAYGFAQFVSGQWEVIDLGTSDVGCGIVPASDLSQFKLRCTP